MSTLETMRALTAALQAETAKMKEAADPSHQAQKELLHLRIVVDKASQACAAAQKELERLLKVSAKEAANDKSALENAKQMDKKAVAHPLLLSKRDTRVQLTDTKHHSKSTWRVQHRYYPCYQMIALAVEPDQDAKWTQHPFEHHWRGYKDFCLDEKSGLWSSRSLPNDSRYRLEIIPGT